MRFRKERFWFEFIDGMEEMGQTVARDGRTLMFWGFLFFYLAAQLILGAKIILSVPGITTLIKHYTFNVSLL